MATCCGCSKETLGSVADRILAEQIRVCEVQCFMESALLRNVCLMNE